MKQSKKGHKTPKLRARAAEFRALKNLYGLTYERMAAITGHHQGSLKQWGCGGKALRTGTLYSIRTALAEYAKGKDLCLVNDPYYQQRAKTLIRNS